MTELTVISALAKNGVIGKDNKIPWYISEDFKRFKSLTTGWPVIMGRKTFESLPEHVRPLPGRKNIVLSRNDSYAPDGAHVVRNMQEAVEKASDYEKAFVIGGSRIFEEGLKMADVLELTMIDKEYEGDTYFPLVNWDDFELVDHQQRDGYSFQTHRRK
ncbi:MAG: dihydrofolate reductase [Nanoarchaeota archaeon]